jgi:hypothetical protein
LISSIGEQKRLTQQLALQLQRTGTAGEEGLSDSLESRPLRQQLSTWTHRHEALMKVTILPYYHNSTVTLVQPCNN